MALETRLDAKLMQKLVLTPQLQQAIKLLQLPQLELSAAINQEMVENPFLEENPEDYTKEDGADLTEGDSSGSSEESTNSDYTSELEMSEQSFSSSISVDDYFEERSSDGRDLGYFNPGYVERPEFETFISDSKDLTDHLIWQVGLCNVSEEIKEVAEMIIGNIDENGYLRATDEELARLLNVDARTVAKVVTFIQSLDPPGVCARNIQECLLIQIKMLALEGTLIEKIVRHNILDLEKKKLNIIAKQYKATIDDVATAVKIIEGLEPKPGRGFSKTQIAYIVPDVFIEKDDDEYRIILNDDNIPKIRISSTYKELLTNKKLLGKDDKQFLIDKYRSAIWLLRSLDERNKTIYRVTESILYFQMDFFEKGVQYLKPLNLKDIAEHINMHESNISRVTSNKYLTCNHGIFPFKFFFSSSLPTQTGDISSTSVKDLIKKIVEEEDSKHPLTDKRIVEILEEKNIKIARRTLAKYREELKIPSHTKRKKSEY
ncbi:MAG: RNA polymerase factor sigma-54 [Candidatus Magnetoovum sp. WYHC-5]|nr:RNA polymerase factor sigma-54 [Candidatus Magnetoovum sp. WYHC-5]